MAYAIAFAIALVIDVAHWLRHEIQPHKGVDTVETLCYHGITNESPNNGRKKG